MSLPAVKRLLAVSLVIFLCCAAAQAQPQLKQYPAQIYTIYTDVDEETAREACVRMTAMANEYHERTKDYAGEIKKKLPFYLFSKAEDYYKAGGLAGSAGIFNGQKLMAIARPDHPEQTWHIVQHEGFHQFVSAVIGGNMPIWINEGMAEYFGEAIFTGDGFVTGLVPPDRLARLKKMLADKQTKPVRDIMLISNKDWNQQISMANYDQAWSMIHFLVHGEGGKYRGAISGVVNDISKHTGYEQAWNRNFGGDIAAFETHWRDYWLAQDDDPTADLRAKAVAVTMTSFFARAVSQRQSFATPEDFFTAAQEGKLKAHKDDYLPPSLLKENLTKAIKLGTWSIQMEENRQPRLLCKLPTGKTLVGSFSVVNAQAEKVTCEYQAEPTSKSTSSQPPKPTQPTISRPAVPTTRPAAAPADPVASAINLARLYIQNGKPDAAKTALENALKTNPESPAADEARRILGELK